MGTPKSQPVNIIVNIDLPENLTWLASSSLLEAWLVEKLRVPVHVLAVKKSLETEGLSESTTPSEMTSTDVCSCEYNLPWDCDHSK
jgi:hypothetical protein